LLGEIKDPLKKRLRCRSSPCEKVHAQLDLARRIHVKFFVSMKYLSTPSSNLFALKAFEVTPQEFL
jgi:hypothetical protein